MSIFRNFLVLFGVVILLGGCNSKASEKLIHVEWMKERNIIKQYGDLEKLITTKEATLFLTKLKHYPRPFTDKDAIQWAIDEKWLDPNTSNQRLNSAQFTELCQKAGIQINFLEPTEYLSQKECYEKVGESITTHITIGHTNDVHGHIVDNVHTQQLGYAKMATIINRWKKENENFLLLDAGDTFQGSIYVNQAKGESVVPILNQLGYTTMAAGNHEFDFGWEQLLKLRDQLEYPMISANVFQENGKELLQPVHYAEVGGRTFAFIGFVTEETPIVTHPKNVTGLHFKNPVAVAKRIVPELKKRVDHVIAVSHVGIEVDKELAKNVPGIDLIIGGHSHTPLRVPERVNNTYIVQDWEYGKALGKADLYYLGNELVFFEGGLIEYSEHIPNDPFIQSLVDEVTSHVDTTLNEKIAETGIPLNGGRVEVRSEETNLGNLMADLLLERTQMMEGYAADIALMNGGGIRASVDQGNITKRDILDIFPFPNTLTIVEVTGEELLRVLENSVSHVEILEGRFCHVSGMRFLYNPKKKPYKRVNQVWIKGEELDLHKKYRVATNDFVTAGGDGFDMMKKDTVLNTGITMFDLLEEALIKHEHIHPIVEGRILVTSDK